MPSAARFDQPGVYKVDAEATRGGLRLGIATRMCWSAASIWR